MDDTGDAQRLWRAGGQQIVPRPANWSIGSEPAWLGVHRPFTVEDVVRALDQRGGPRRAEVTFTAPRSSAVLVALVDGVDGAEVLLTRRSWDLRNHRGEVSFPGGRVDPGESEVAAALREAYEEVALDPLLVNVIGELDHLSTFVSNSYIVPVVGRLEQRPELLAAAAEVERIFYVSLAELTRADTYREEHWGGEEQWDREEQWGDQALTRRLHFFELDDETIWGATARILHNLLDVLHSASDDDG